MTKKTVLVACLSVLSVLLGLCVVLCIFLMPATLGGEKNPAAEELGEVDYTKRPPGAGLLFLDERDRGIFLFLDFESTTAQVCLFPEKAAEKSEELTWRTDYTFLMKEGFLGGLADRLGGVQMTLGGQNSLWFSAALDEFCRKDLTEADLEEISCKFFEKISKTGLSSEDFMFIIEESETRLPYSVCYDWIPYVSELFANCIFY